MFWSNGRVKVQENWNDFSLDLFLFSKGLCVSSQFLKNVLKIKYLLYFLSS